MGDLDQPRLRLVFGIRNLLERDGGPLLPVVRPDPGAGDLVEDDGGGLGVEISSVHLHSQTLTARELKF